MYATRGHAGWLEETVAATADWLKRSGTPDRATIDCLRAAAHLRAVHTDPPFPPDEVEYVARQAGKIYHGER